MPKHGWYVRAGRHTQGLSSSCILTVPHQPCCAQPAGLVASPLPPPQPHHHVHSTALLSRRRQPHRRAACFPIHPPSQHHRVLGCACSHTRAAPCAHTERASADLMARYSPALPAIVWLTKPLVPPLTPGITLCALRVCADTHPAQHWRYTQTPPIRRSAVAAVLPQTLLCATSIDSQHVCVSPLPTHVAQAPPRSRHSPHQTAACCSPAGRPPAARRRPPQTAAAPAGRHPAAQCWRRKGSRTHRP